VRKGIWKSRKAEVAVKTVLTKSKFEDEVSYISWFTAQEKLCGCMHIGYLPITIAITTTTVMSMTISYDVQTLVFWDLVHVLHQF